MPAARKTDPKTSHKAAKSVKNVSETQSFILRALRKPMTDQQIAQVYRSYKTAPYASDSGLRTRRSELVSLGLVKATQDTRKTASGRQAIVWAKA